ncbi:MAG: sugar transporter permease [Eubacterium sp.]|nr:sugar transporter permease [Eubacterium sp.]
MKDNKLYSYRLVMPALLLYSTLFILPAIIGSYFSFTDWTIGKDTISFIGFENFKTIFTDSELVDAIANTFIYAIIVVIFKNGLGLLLSLAVNAKIPATNFFRAVFYLPAVISSIVIGLVFTRVLHPEGILNATLNSLGLGFLALDWLTDIRIVIFTIAAVSIWQWTGYHMAIYLAGLQGIPADYYEAAEIDGAGAFQKFRHITIPMLAPSININVILSLIGGLRVFSEVYALTNGGPGNASQVLTTEVLKMFGSGSWGMGTAMNTVLMVIVGLISIPLLYNMRKQEVEE